MNKRLNYEYIFGTMRFFNIILGLTTLWASVAYYGDNFTFFRFISIKNVVGYVSYIIIFWKMLFFTVVVCNRIFYFIINMSKFK